MVGVLAQYFRVSVDADVSLGCTLTTSCRDCEQFNKLWSKRCEMSRIPSAALAYGQNLPKVKPTKGYHARWAIGTGAWLIEHHHPRILRFCLDTLIRGTRSDKAP